MTRDPDTAAVRRLAQASAWRVALFEADVETSDEFEAWLAGDARNAEAWAQVCAPWDRFGAEAMSPELITARRDALDRARRQQRRRLGAGGLWRGGGWRLAAGLAVAAVLAGAGSFAAWRAWAPDVYQTALGERRVVTLADGSRVFLDSGTRLTVRLRRGARSLDLERGQARFNVAHDVTRPFSVHARDKTVIATGTSFNVDVGGPGVVVTLIEGRVSILQDRPRPALGVRPRPVVVARLTAGEELVAPPPAAEAAGQRPVVEAASLARASAWESGQLVFEDEPLASVAARVGRYYPHPVVAEGAARTMRLSGVFDAGDMRSFSEAVQRVLPVTVETEDDGSIHLRPAGP